MTKKKATERTRPGGRHGGAGQQGERAADVPYTMKLPDGRTVYVEVPAEHVDRERRAGVQTRGCTISRPRARVGAAGRLAAPPGVHRGPAECARYDAGRVRQGRGCGQDDGLAMGAGRHPAESRGRREDSGTGEPREATGRGPEHVSSRTRRSCERDERVKKASPVYSWRRLTSMPPPGLEPGTR